MAQRIEEESTTGNKSDSRPMLRLPIKQYHDHMSIEHQKPVAELRPLGEGDRSHGYITNAQAEAMGDLVPAVVLAGQGRGTDGKLLPGASCLNPGGRPKTRVMRDALLKHFQKNPEQLERVIQTAVDKAEAGEVQFFKEIRDMLDGKPAIAITGDDGGPLEFSMVDARTKLMTDLGGE